MSDDPFDECQCGDRREQHHDLGCMICMHGTPPPDGPDGCRRFRLGFRVGERQARLEMLKGPGWSPTFGVADDQPGL